MRKFLFRGKKIASGEWVEGSLLDYGDGDFDICVPCTEDGENGLYKYCVCPETVGQFTGLTDKNGKKIFEGDLVRAERICNGDTWFGSVFWWKGCFAIQGVKDRNIPAIDLFRDYEVVGNVHDNPELLEVGS